MSGGRQARVPRPRSKRGVGGTTASEREDFVGPRPADASFPKHAVDFCLREAGIVEEVAYVGFYDKPLLKFERILETYLSERALIRRVAT